MSAATCAACGGVIGKGERFVLAGTEVFHRNAACVRDIARSALTRAKAETLQVREQLARVEREALSLRRELADTKLELQGMETEWDATRKLLNRAENARVGERQRVTEQARLVENADRQLDAIRGQLRQSQNELATARAEIARLQSDALRRATDDLPVPAEKDTRDATEIRFSLLEIDPP